MAARAASVAESVKRRRDRRPPLKVAAFASSPAPATAQPSKVTQKRQAVHKKVVSSSGPNRRGKTVTKRRKASDRSHESVGELLRRKALAAVLKASAAKYKQQKRQRQWKGTAEPSDMDDGSLTHQAIRKYVEEQLDDDSKLAGAKLTTELRMAKDSLKQVGLTVSDVKRVRLASDTDVELSELEDDDDACEEAAVNLLSKHPLSAVPNTKSKSTPARDGSRTRSKSAAARQAGMSDRDYELATDEDEMASGADAHVAEASDAESVPASSRRGRKTAKEKAQAPATKVAKKRVEVAKPKKSDALSRLRKDQLIARVKGLEVQVAAVAPQEAGPDLAEDEKAPLVEAERELAELTEANRHWRATAIILRRRLAQHEDVSDIDCDEQEAFGSAAREDASAGDAHSAAGPSSPEQQMFDAYVDARAVASGSGDLAVSHPDDGVGFAAPDFPQLEFETDDDGSPRSNGKGKGRAPPSEAASSLRASSSGPFHSVASSSSPNKSYADRASSPFGRTGHAVTEPSSPLSSPTRAPVQGSLLDNVGQKALQEEQLRCIALKEELALATRAYQEQAMELTALSSDVVILKAKLAETEAARTAAIRSVESKVAGDHQELSDRLKEYADALTDANNRVRALEADIEEHEKRAKARELNLASVQADYEGVLAQERRAHAAAAEALERVKALEAALQQSKADALATRSSRSEEVEAMRKQKEDAITERDRARFEIARLKTSCAEYETAVDKSSRELGDLTADRNRLAAECERLAAEKEHETEALDHSMEQRRVVELERDRLRQVLGEKEQELERVARSHQVAIQLDQQTVTELTHTTSEQQARIEELEEALESLRSRAEEAEQERANTQVLREEVAEWREKYEQAEAARAAQEGDHAAQACRVTELETALHKLELSLLDSESEASRAAAQVDKMSADCRGLKEERARLAARIRQTLESLGGQANSDSNDDISLLLDSVFQQVEQEAGRLQQVAVENTSRLDLLNFATSFARDIVALLPGDGAAAQTTSSLEGLLAATLTGVRDLHAARAQALHESDAATEAIDAQRLTLVGMLRTLQDVVLSDEPSELADETDPDRVVGAEDLTTLARTTTELVDKLVESFKTLDERYGSLEEALRKSEEEWEVREVELVERQRKIKSLTEELKAESAARGMLEERVQEIRRAANAPMPAAAAGGAQGSASAMEASQRMSGDA